MVQLYKSGNFFSFGAARKVKELESWSCFILERKREVLLPIRTQLVIYKSIKGALFLYLSLKEHGKLSLKFPECTNEISFVCAFFPSLPKEIQPKAVWIFRIWITVFYNIWSSSSSALVWKTETLCVDRDVDISFQIAPPSGQVRKRTRQSPRC